ncbi:hypothetical protein [Collimonas humicola]|uniref:hypothetical protein n=1 Tax=Collimonas humicola TaxID=2825886 RepID=UPI001B8BB9AC|nr:hypothetical protein [Collimonas humicola]
MSQAQENSSSPPCKLILSRSQLELGRISLGSLNVMRRTQGQISLGKQTLMLNVFCAVPTRFSIQLRGDSGAGVDNVHRLSAANDATWLKLKLQEALADGKAATWTSQRDVFRNGQTIVLAPGDSVSPQIAGQSTPIMQLGVVAEVEILHDAARTKFSSDQDLSGQFSFEIKSF